MDEQWSPEQISNWLKLYGHESVSHTWIYQHIAQDKIVGGELHNHMRNGNYSKGHKEYKGTIIPQFGIRSSKKKGDIRIAG